jgi:hypothetical protein
MFWIRFEITLSAADLLNLQIVTSIMPQMVSLCLSTASFVMGYPSNSSSSKEPLIQLSSVVAFLEIQSTSDAAYEYPIS